MHRGDRARGNLDRRGVQFLIADVAGAGLDQDASLGTALVLNIGLGLWDRKKTAAVGYNLEAAPAILLGPPYMIERARKAPRTTAVTLTWFGAFLVSPLFYY